MSAVGVPVVELNRTHGRYTLHAQRRHDESSEGHD